MTRPSSRSGAALVALATALTLFAGCAPRTATTPAAGAPPAGAQRPADTSAAGQDTTPRPAAGPAQPRPYNRVITSAARTQRGMFITHQVNERLFFEIPRNELNKDMIVIQRAVAGTASGGNRIYRWERQGNRIFLRQQSFAMTADNELPIARAVEAAQFAPYAASFNIETFGPDSAAVIDVTRLFTTNMSGFVAVRGIQADRTMIEQVITRPENVDIIALQTGAAPEPGAPAGTAPAPISARVSWSILKLPENPMMPRLHDKRVGIISITTTDFGRAEHRAEQRRYVRRFRLEKRDPNAAVSEPVEQIVFWIDPATPAWLVPYVKAGVAEWVPAYEGAGFRNAIVAREAPSPAEDPNWSMHDARNSMIYWRATTVQNATGGQTVDPRTGEIIKAEVNMHHNIMNLLRNWYFVQAAPLDPRAQQLPLPDSLMGRLVQYVVSHEIGHAIGFPHNMKSSSMYPVDSLRSASFIRRMGGHVATLMDYSRMNYVAQPEDSIPVELLIPAVGPYDHYAVMWQVKPIPGARTPDEEWPTLDSWSRMQDTIPWFRFETSDATGDPGAITEAVGDEDAVKASTLGLRNLERVVGMLLNVAERPGEDYTLLQELYGQAVGQWSRYMSHVAAVVGGAESQERYGTGPRFEPLSRARQREAVLFLNENAFRPPAYFLDRELLRRMEQEGAVSRFRGPQMSILNTLLADSRLNRLIEYEALAGPGQQKYTVANLLADLRTGIWGELSSNRPVIDVYRRNLQRAYIEAVGVRVNPPPPAANASLSISNDARPILRGELVELDRVVEQAIRRTNDPMTRLHLQDVHLQIQRILDPPRR
jgi:hypothetical protein